MTRAALLLFASIAACAVGAVAAGRVRRTVETSRLPPRRVRPPALEAALAAWEARGTPVLAGLEASDPESEAELAFLRAAASGDDAALLDVARRHEGRDAAARALWLLVERSPDAATRAARRAAFATRWPRAWVLTGARGSR